MHEGFIASPWHVFHSLVTQLFLGFQSCHYRLYLSSWKTKFNEVYHIYMIEF